MNDVGGEEQAGPGEELSHQAVPAKTDGSPKAVLPETDQAGAPEGMLLHDQASASQQAGRDGKAIAGPHVGDGRYGLRRIIALKADKAKDPDGFQKQGDGQADAPGGFNAQEQVRAKSRQGKEGKGHDGELGH